MATINTNFSAKQHGFHFTNRFEFKFPVKFQLPFVGPIELGDVVFGLCGGMCFGALDYFRLGVHTPSYTAVDQIDRKLFTFLCDRQLDSLRLPVILKVIQGMLAEKEDFALQMARYEIPKLRRLLDKGQPGVLALIRAQGISDPTRNHQVLATGYEFDPLTKDMAIRLYDPNHPGIEPLLHLNLSRPSQGIDIRQSTGEELRGFFLINYRAQAVVPTAIEPEAFIPFDVAETVQKFVLQWPVDSRRVNQYFGENPATYKPFKLPGHEGLDLYALSSANIYAAADGEVYEVGHPRDHPYGLQIRIKHDMAGKVYKTIYAHLSEAFVAVGQKVTAGERIALADNSGNSFGSHLHLTLKIDGEKTPGYPAGIVDPWPYLQAEPHPPVEKDLPPLSGLVVFTAEQINLRAQPDTTSQVRTILPAGEALSVLGNAANVQRKIGQQGEWLQVLTAGGLPGFVAAWLVQSSDQPFPPSDLVLYPVDTVNLRSGPATAFDMLATLTATDPLTVLGDADNASAKLGRQGEWIQVQTENGQRGFIAAWLVRKTGQPVSASDLVVYPLDTLNVRARPSIDSNPLTIAAPGDKLVVLGDKALARESIGKMDRWLNVRTPEGFSGYVAAWLVRTSAGGEPPEQPAGRELSVFPTADLNLRAQPSLNSPRVTGAFRNEQLRVVEDDLQAAQDKVGKNELWVHVLKKDGSRGWAAAWFLSLAPV